MLRPRALSVALCATFLISCSSGIRGPRKARMTIKEIVDASKPAIVRIETRFANGRKAVGTGFVISKDGRIATNLHVIQGSQDIRVRLLDGTRMPVEKVVNVDPKRDLAIIQVDPARKLPTLSLGDSDRVAAGDRVIAIGNPLGVLDYTVSDGLISSVRLLGPELTVLQISAPISEGSSGGPLFNNYGEVIGVATMIAREGQNLNFGVPVNYLQPLMKERHNWTPAQFAARFRARRSAKDKQERIVHKVPKLQVKQLARCTDADLIKAFREIGKAIKLGAPLYNNGKHEACFRIYEGTAMRLERELDCPALRDTLGQGLLRASTKKSFSAKAWAMRDAFDGIIKVIVAKAEAQRNSSP